MVKKGRRISSRSEQDGGMFALAGFVNQMLGSAEDFARCITAPQESEALISFETEVVGQDTMRTSETPKGKRILVLTQYKFSIAPNQHPIGPAELKRLLPR
jgi:hypothetical protein